MISSETGSPSAECECLSRRREIWRAIDESVGPSFIVDEEGGIEAWSAEGRRLMGEHAARGGSDELATLVKGVEAECRLDTGGSRRDFVIRRITLMRAGRTTGSTFVVLTDVTERKAAERQRESLRRALETSRKLEALSTLAGGIAHEMNNLLQPIIGLTSAVLEGMPAGGRDAEALGVVMEAANRAAELVAGILRFSRGSDAGKYGDVDLVDPEAEVRSGVALLRGAMGPGLELITRLDGAAPTVLIPKGVIERLVVDLGLNAVRAMAGREGAIVITAGRVEEGDPDFGETMTGGALIRVEDEGEGMPRGVLERCLDPFFTTKPAGEGVGLGLSVAHASVVAARGRLVVRERAGGGTLVALALPAADMGRDDSDERR